MKIQCDVCERAEAALLCCADEAALCWGCDEKVHAANKLAGKHQRVPLLPRSSSSSKSSSSQIPICDICQEVGGYFFCLEDRALLCRQCDVSVHTASPYVSSHQRFLITGVRVALQHHLNNSGTDKSSSSNSYSSNNPLSSLASSNSTASKKFSASSTSYAGEEMEGLKSQWSWSELLDDVELDACYGVSEPGSSS